MKLATWGVALVLTGGLVVYTVNKDRQASPETCKAAAMSIARAEVAAATSLQDLKVRLAAWDANPPTECDGLTRSQKEVIANQVTAELKSLIISKAIEWSTSQTPKGTA